MYFNTLFQLSEFPTMLPYRMDKLRTVPLSGSI
jgi:hypothetical protein